MSGISPWMNTMQEWSMTNVAGHPLHLHVNPFQLIEIAGAVYSPAARSSCDLEFGNTCVGEWLDTLHLPTSAAGGKSNVKFRFVTDTLWEMRSCTALPGSRGPWLHNILSDRAEMWFFTSANYCQPNLEHQSLPLVTAAESGTPALPGLVGSRCL